MRATTRCIAFLLSMLNGTVLLPHEAAAAPYTEHVLKNFCEMRHCTPSRPESGLLLGDDGNLYGTAGSDAFMMVPDGSGGWSYHIIAAGIGGGLRAPLIRDTAGNLYGTNTSQIFRLTPNADRSSWTSRVVYTFCTEMFCPNGNWPSGGLSYAGSASGAPYDGVSPLYGTTAIGGVYSNDYNGGGVAFSLAPGAGDTWTETTLYDFCALADCADGMEPESGVALDASGNLIGTTGQGGTIKKWGHHPPGGTVFKLANTGSGWTHSVLYNFCTKHNRSNCLDGLNPSAGVVINAAGDIFGTTVHGGQSFGGVAYRLKPKNGGYEFHVVYDGAGGSSSMTLASSGDLYGTSESVVYKLSSEGGTWALTGLYAFCRSNCRDGANPSSSTVIFDSAGNLYGTTVAGGKHNGGTVFELTP